MINMYTAISVFFQGDSRQVVSASSICLRRVTEILLVMVIILCWTVNANAQSGTVIGWASNAATGESVAGVTLVLPGTGHKALTDSDGRFLLPRVPAGEHVLEAVCIGHVRQELRFVVQENQTVEQHIEMVPLEVPGDRIFSDAYRNGHSRVLRRERQSVGNHSAISSEQIDRYGDYTVADAMARIPGVQVGRMGEVNIRGAGRQAYSVLVDGQRMPTAALGNRSMDPGSISIDMIRDIELIKTITPDMDADALGGAVHIHTQRPAGGQRHLEVRLGGGTDNTRYFNYTGPDSRATLSYSESPREDFSIALNLSYQTVQRSWESLATDYQVTEMGNGPVDVLENLAPMLNINDQTNLGGRLHLTYQPSNRTTAHIQGIIVNDNRVLNRHTTTYSAGGDWINPDSTGLQGEQGGYVYDAYSQTPSLQQYMFQSGIKHHFTLFELSINAGWARSRIEQDRYRFPFQATSMDYTVNMENRLRPSMQIENFNLMLDGTIDRRLLRFMDFDHINDVHVDNTWSAGMDIEVPFTAGSVKFGSQALLIRKKGDYSESLLTKPPPASYLFNFSMIPDGYFDVLDHYRIPWVINTENALMFVEGLKPGLRRDDALFFKRSEIWNNKAGEDIYSGYGMGTFEWGPITVTGGLRIEHTDSRYDGRSVVFNRFDRFEYSTDTTQATSYTDLFPNVQVSLALTEMSRIGLAYTQSIARPDFNLLTPFQLTNAADTTIFRGNPYLEPIRSENVDFFFSHFFQNTGQIGAGLFYKELSGFIVENQQIVEVQEGEYDGFSAFFNEETTRIPAQERTFINGDEKATIYGVELFWQQYLDFLPGFLGNFGTYANYTWSHSVYDVDYRSDEVNFPHQSPHVVNVALFYNQGRFSVQTAYHWTDTSVHELQKNPTYAPSLQREIYRDLYEDGARRLSMSMRFRISENFRFWADVVNLFNVERLQYEYSREYYPRVINDRGDGFGFRAGIQFTL